MQKNAFGSKTFLDLATTAATYSPHPTKKVGCVISGHAPYDTGAANRHHKYHVSACNRPAKGFEDLDYSGESCVMNPLSRKRLFLHAEYIAILKYYEKRVYNPEIFVSPTLYCTHVPCESCALMIVESGIMKVVTGGMWGKHNCDFSLHILKEAGVEVSYGARS